MTLAFREPSASNLLEIAAKYYMELSPAEIQEYQELINSATKSYKWLDHAVEPKPPVKYARGTGHRSTSEEDPLNAWRWRSSIQGESSGPISGKKIGVKDSVCVAGVPMTIGASLMEGYIPDVDATIVTRILEAGGEIVGKTTCESFCLSAGSHTSDPLPVYNPRNSAYSAGGSSSGSAAALVAGDCDMAIGGDQGGSIRIPSSWCGCCGLKPTYGLVPYTGIFPIEPTLDHVGPMARTVEEVALLLEVIAGPDRMDPRQEGIVSGSYTQALTGDISGMRIGILEEGFGWENASEADVDQLVTKSAQSLEELGAEVQTVSIPVHRDGDHLWNAIALEGALATMVKGEALGSGWKGFYNTGLAEFYGRARRARANDYPATAKMLILLSDYMAQNYYGKYYAKAQNLARELSTAYAYALENVDVLVMPTTPMKAQPLPKDDQSLKEYVDSGLGIMKLNTGPFNVTGHPAISVPCGVAGGLPIGMMIVGRYYEEITVLQVAHAFEQYK